MVWVFVFVGIALAGVVMLISYGNWLAHKAADVMSEVAMMGDRAAELAGLLGQVQLPPQRSSEATMPRRRLTPDRALDRESTT